VEFIVNLAATGADAARTIGLIIGAAVFLLAGATLLVAMRFRATRKGTRPADEIPADDVSADEAPGDDASSDETK